jgi:hypothetical protein
MRLGQDVVDDRTNYLAVTLDALLRWSRTRKAAGVRPPTLATTRNTDDRVSDRIAQFNVFDHR